MTLESKRVSLLALLTRAILQIDDADVASRSMKVEWHHYRINEPIGGSRAVGHEIVITTDVETPAGDSVSVSLARFFAAGCLEKTFPRDPWVLKTALSISLP